jgi:GNAT superfamily N-acetyltransferase
VAIIYRTPTEADIPELANLHVLCWQQSYAAILPAEYLKNLSIEQRAEGWCATINDPEVFSLVACEGERIVGFVTAGPARTNLLELQGLGDGEVYAIYNHSDFYRRGIGRRFLVEAARFWLSRHGRALAIFFMAQNARAELFYRALGGAPAYEGLFEVAGINVDDKGYVFSNLAELAAMT